MPSAVSRAGEWQGRRGGRRWWSCGSRDERGRGDGRASTSRGARGRRRACWWSSVVVVERVERGRVVVVRREVVVDEVVEPESSSSTRWSRRRVVVEAASTWSCVEASDRRGQLRRRLATTWSSWTASSTRSSGQDGVDDVVVDGVGTSPRSWTTWCWTWSWASRSSTWSTSSCVLVVVAPGTARRSTRRSRFWMSDRRRRHRAGDDRLARPPRELVHVRRDELAGDRQARAGREERSRRTDCRRGRSR